MNPRPVILGVVGDSAAGKTTITRGLVRALGEDNVSHICTDDYHRYDRRQRGELGMTPLHPDCNYMQIMEQHLQLLAMGEPVLKPVYDHSTGLLTRPRLVEPREVVIAEGLLPLHTKLAARQEDERRRIITGAERFAASLRKALAESGAEEGVLFRRVEGRGDEREIAQFRRDRQSWQDRLARLEADRDRELEHVADRYRDVRPHGFPVAVIFVVPRREAVR